MGFSETADFLEGARYRERISWEQTRLIMYVSACSGGLKGKGAEEFFPLPWDKLHEEQILCPSDLEKLRDRANSIAELLNKPQNNE